MAKHSHELPQSGNIDPQFAPSSVSVGGIRGFIRKFRRQPQASYEQSVTEQALPAETEVPLVESENYKLLRSFVSQEALQAVISDAEKLLETPEMQEIGTLIAQKEAYEKEAGEADKTAGYFAAKPIYAQMDILDDYLRSPDVRTGFLRYSEMLETKALAERGRRRVAGDSSEAKKLVGLFDRLPQVESDKDAPYAKYTDNDETAWQYVADSSVRQYLAQHRFVDTDRIGRNDGSVVVDGVPGRPYEVPLSAVVHAAGFDSWQGRDPRYGKHWDSKYGAGSMDSLAVIKHYAGLETELPPVGRMNVYVQPDGQIFCDNGAGDSHRIAAAILRGQNTVQANELEFILLKENVLASPE